MLKSARRKEIFITNKIDYLGCSVCGCVSYPFVYVPYISIKLGVNIFVNEEKLPQHTTSTI